MTEEEWFRATDAGVLLKVAIRASTPRKLRSFMVGCCRSGWDRYGIPAIGRVLETVERYADGDVGSDVIKDLHRRHGGPRFLWGLPVEPLLSSDHRLERAVTEFLASMANASPPYGLVELAQAEKVARAALLRDIVGNPFRPVAFSPEWRSSTAVAIARGMYESRDFSPMPILADALQDAGCDTDDVLNHCRDPQQLHVRGCWVVDLVLGLS